MPAYSSKITIPNGQILIWHLTESVEDLKTLAPSTIDLEELAGIHHFQKKREWLASKILLEQLCQNLSIPYLGTRKDEHGKPFLLGSNQEISVSHSSDFVVIVAHEFPIGLDIERPSEKLQRVAKRFLNERECIESRLDLNVLSHYWCAKEALFKLYGKHGISLRDDIKIELHPTEEHVLYGTVAGKDCIIHLSKLDNYTLAIAQYH